MSDEKTYSEREVAAIIERAVERQEEARRSRPETGLSMDELERLGREVGIDPAYLRAAAAEVESGGRMSGRVAEQTHTHVVVERWLPGPLVVEAWEDAALELERRFGADATSAWGHSGGGLRQAGNTYEWSHTSGLGVETKIVARARGDRTQLRLTQKVGVARSAVEGPLWGGVLTLMLGVALIPALKLFPNDIAFFLAFIASLFALLSVVVFQLDRQWRAKKLRALDALADELGPKLVAPVAEAPAVSAPAVSAPAVSAPAEAAPETGAVRPALTLDAPDGTTDEAADAERTARRRARS